MCGHLTTLNNLLLKLNLNVFIITIKDQIDYDCLNGL